MDLESSMRDRSLFMEMGGRRQNLGMEVRVLVLEKKEGEMKERRKK